MDKLSEKIVLHKETNTKATQPVFLDIDIHTQLLALKAETGIPIRKIVEKFIKHGLNNVVIEEQNDN